jgi:hypothetical protein
MNIYYDPEKFGFEIVGEVEFSSGCYEFDTSVLWRSTDDNSFYVADDSGCSCPMPFGDVGVNDLKPVTKLQDLIDYFEQRKKESYRYDPTDEYGRTAEIDGAIGALIGKYREIHDPANDAWRNDE